MEVDEIPCKYPKISNGNRKIVSTKIGKMDDQYPDEEEDGENKRGGAAIGGGVVRVGGVDLGGGVGRLYGWPSSRIVRVSRASGGKDRHSKVLTSKGLRDRRVRLSVNTAIQFYDLQDRLGYDQPSKAVEWLLKAAATSISELPPMNSPFPDTPKQLSDEKRSSTAGSDQLGFDSAEVDMDGGGGGGGDPNYTHHHQLTKSSACSSNSENSKGSGGLSLSRSESRIKARERAKGRVAEKEKEKDNNESPRVSSLNPISQTTSFTELLSGGINGVNNSTNGGSVSVHQHPNTNESNFFLKSPRHWSNTPMDYFTTGLLGPQANRSGQMHLTANPFFSVTGDHQPELHQFSFAPDHLAPDINAAGAGGNNSTSSSNNHHHHHSGGGEYNLNFTISSSANSSGLAGYNRGTLQSNSSSPSSMMPHLQRFSDGPPPSFFVGGGAAAAAPVENHHQQFLSGYDPAGRLQLFYGDAHASTGQKGKGKN